MNGILVVDKPAGFTSFDVVAKLRGICQTKKIGHGGTLDPMATGVLPVFVGPAVKAVDLQPRQDKCYEATVRFGTATDTGDITGSVLRTGPAAFSPAEVQRALPAFVGKRSQLPPMYSAVKVNGTPLYKLARQGKTVQRKEREIEIFALEWLGGAGEEHWLRVHCSKGTYVRTLAEEIAAALGSCGTLAALRRTAAGVFDLAQAHTLETIQSAKNNGTLDSLFVDTAVVFDSLPELVLPGDEPLRRLANGAPLYRLAAEPGRYRAMTNGGFVGLVQVDRQGTGRAEKMFL